MSENFESMIKTSLHRSVHELSSKNLGDLAIEEAELRKGRIHRMKNRRTPVRMIAAAVFTFVVGFGSVFAFSEDARNATINVFHSIFTAEKQGDEYQLVEKDAAAEMALMNVAGIKIDQFSKDVLEKKLGFIPYLPKSVGKFNFNSSRTLLGMKLEGSPLEMEKYSADYLMECLLNDTQRDTLMHLNPRLYVIGEVGNGLSLSMHKAGSSKLEEQNDNEVVKTFTVNGVSCSHIKEVRPDYSTKEDGNAVKDDIFTKPESMETYENLFFEMDGIRYNVCIVSGNVQEAYDFAKAYIESYQNH